MSRDSLSTAASASGVNHATRGTSLIRPLAGALLVVAAIGVAGASRTTAIATDPGPGVRNAHGLAFDGQASVLFGGATDRKVVAETWAWDGMTWRRFDAPGPDGRTFPVMVAAPGDGVYLFGGRRVLFGTDLQPSQFMSDLWQWDGHAWTRIPSDGPSGRAEAAGAWDPRRRRLVVFGGYDIRDGALHRLGDTWEFGDGHWQERSGVAGPSPRHGAVAAFDDALGEVVLFGGNGGLSDTWAWNGTRWRRIDAGAVPGRYNAAASAGAPGLPVLRFGGWDGRRRQSDTWTLRSGVWVRPFSRGPTPSPRNHAAMTYDAVRRRFVVVGGHEGGRVFGDVWEADYEGWRRVHTVPARRRVENQH